MAVTRDEVIEALRPVQDPELHQSIVDLDMVREVTIDGGSVRVLIALTVAGCPLRAEITQRVTGAVQPLAGVEAVTVDMTVMSDEDRAKLREKLQGGAGGHGHDHAGHDHGRSQGRAARPIPFRDQSTKTRVLGISSGKGGVGKSSVTVNTAIALSRLGYTAAILDADVYGFSVPRMLGISDPPVVIDEMLIPPLAHGVQCISMGFFIEEDQAVIWRGPMLHKALEQFLTDVYWGEPDYLLVDMPPGTGDIALSMAQYLPGAEIYVVTTPQPAAQRVAQRTGAMARKLNLPLRGVIENMSWFTGDDGKRYELFGAGGGESLAADLGVPLLGQLPLVPALREGGDVGLPITAVDPDGEAAQAFAAVAKEIVNLGAARVYKPELKIK